jgi:hypothetical protein
MKRRFVPGNLPPIAEKEGELKTKRDVRPFERIAPCEQKPVRGRHAIKARSGQLQKDLDEAGTARPSRDGGASTLPAA